MGYKTGKHPPQSVPETQNTHLIGRLIVSNISIQSISIISVAYISRLTTVLLEHEPIREKKQETTFCPQ